MCVLCDGGILTGNQDAACGRDFFDIGVFLNIEPDHIGPGEHASLQSICTVKAGCFGSVRQELSTVMTGIRKNTVWSYL